MAEALSDYVLLNLKILPDEVGAIEAVGHDAANVCGRQYNGIGAFAVKKLCHGALVKQIEFGMCAAYDVFIAFAFEIGHDGRTNQTAVAGYVDF